RDGRRREVDDDEGAAARRVVDGDVGPGPLGEVMQDAEADAGPVGADRLGVVETVEADEHAATLLTRDARSLIGDREAGAVAVAGDGDRDGGARRGVLAGVRQ